MGSYGPGEIWVQSQADYVTDILAAILEESLDHNNDKVNT